MLDENLKKYAMYFTAFLFNNLGKEKDNIVRIILFGSVAKEDAEKDSDIDIFIEVKKETEKSEKIIREVADSFYNSREASLFKLKGMDNVFDIKIGKLKEWEDLERSIGSTGIVLYGPYETKELPSGVKHSVIIFWNKINKNRGAFLNKLYGFKVDGKLYEGQVSKFGGQRLGKSCVMVPIQYRRDIFKLLKRYEVEAKVIEVWSD